MTGSGSALTRLGGVLAAVAAVAAVAGCSGSGSPPAAAGSGTTSASSPAPSSASSPPPSSAPSSASGTGASSPAGGSPSASAAGAGGSADACATGDLSVTAGQSEGAAGSVYTTLVFTNTGSADCTLYGYPGVSLAAGNPATQVGAAASRSTMNSPALVTLPPGGRGNALLRVTEALNYPSARCAPANTSYLRVYPPNQTTSVLVPYKSMGCGDTTVNLLTIGVVRAGATSSP